MGNASFVERLFLHRPPQKRTTSSQLPMRIQSPQHNGSFACT